MPCAILSPLPSHNHRHLIIICSSDGETNIYKCTLAFAPNNRITILPNRFMTTVSPTTIYAACDSNIWPKTHRKSVRRNDQRRAILIKPRVIYTKSSRSLNERERERERDRLTPQTRLIHPRELIISIEFALYAELIKLKYWYNSPPDGPEPKYNMVFEEGASTCMCVCAVGVYIGGKERDRGVDPLRRTIRNSFSSAGWQKNCAQARAGKSLMYSRLCAQKRPAHLLRPRVV